MVCCCVVLCCFCCDMYLCASLVIYNALLYGVFCCVFVLFCLTQLFVCLVCDMFVMLSGLCCVLFYVYVGVWVQCVCVFCLLSGVACFVCLCVLCDCA